MKTSKIFNDPVYGFITVPYGILFELIEHPFFQRLRRISQLGLSSLVYPGAKHSRFQHALGALHLTMQAIEVLKAKGAEISDAEAEGVCIAVLLHDIGHSPFSHALEYKLINVHHEQLSLMLMEALNESFDQRLSLGIEIFRGSYPRRFLHQLVSGQLDMDRMDYLNRDSFFTGVSEGVIGYDRLIKMLDVRDDSIVVEEKGIYSIEKFLVARRIMYWQVYLHKTAISAEKMLVATIDRLRELYKTNPNKFEIAPSLNFFISNSWTIDEIRKHKHEIIKHYVKLDDIDVMYSIKILSECDDFLLSFLSNGILERKLFKIKTKNTPFGSDEIYNTRHKCENFFGITESESNYLVVTGKESNTSYIPFKEEIKILYKDGEVRFYSQSSEFKNLSNSVEKYYLCRPKEIL